MKKDLKLPLISLIILLTCSFTASSFAIGTEESLGRSRLKQSLNKRITVTKNGSWTEHTGANTGIDTNIQICPPRYRSYTKMKKNNYQDNGYFSDKYNIRGRWGIWGRCRP